MPQLGSHMSIAGGYWKAVEAAAQAGCDCVQLFTKNSNQWAAKPITESDIELFQSALQRLAIRHPVSHTSYLINLASPQAELREKSTTALIVELQRAAQLGIGGVILHPGSPLQDTPSEGLTRIAQHLQFALEQTKQLPVDVLLENTAGQGSHLGWKFEHFRILLGSVERTERIGICFDTCHAFAAGYDLASAQGYEAMWSEFDREIGVTKLRAIHLNDSQKGLGSRIDRHAHIGTGAIGLDGFRRLLNDARFAEVPMYLETEKGLDPSGEDWDRVNLRTLRQLLS